MHRLQEFGAGMFAVPAGAAGRSLEEQVGEIL